MSKSKFARIDDTIRVGMEECLAGDGLSLATANNVDKGRAFMKFYTQDIVRYLENWSNFDENRFDDYVCDGSKDFGIDFVYEHPEPEDKRFWICQSKYKGSGASLTRGDIANFFEIHRRILDESALAGANRAVRDLLSDFTESSIATFVLLTNGRASNDNLDEFRRLRKKAKDDARGGAENFEWELVDLEEIANQHVKIQSLDSKPPTVRMHMRPFGKQRGFIEVDLKSHKNEKTYKTVVITVKGTELAELYKEHDQSLFNDNIRGFLGSSVKKNKKIKDTLSKEPEFFYLYNNGVSAICGNLDVVKDNGGYLVDCKDFQIINGAQTVSTIGEFDKEFRNDRSLGKNLEKVWVLMRITQTEAVQCSEGLNKEIIVANNTQNIIKDADFHSNDPVQNSIAKQFEKYKFKYQADTSRKALKLKYIPKRIHTGKETGNLPVKMEDFAKSLYAFQFDTPEKLNSQTNFLFHESGDGCYRDIFGDPDGSISPSEAEKFAAIAMINHYLTTKLKKRMNAKDKNGELEHPRDSVDGMALRAGRHVLWAFGYIIRSLPKGSEQEIYKKIVDGIAFEKNGFVERWFERIVRLIRRQLRRDNEGNKTLNFKSWLRDNQKVQNLIQEIDDDMQDDVRGFTVD